MARSAVGSQSPNVKMSPFCLFEENSGRITCIIFVVSSGKEMALQMSSSYLVCWKLSIETKILLCISVLMSRRFFGHVKLDLCL